MTKENDDALELADQLDQFKNKRMNDAARHIRSLVAQNDALWTSRWFWADKASDLSKDCHDARQRLECATSLVRELVLALKTCQIKSSLDGEVRDVTPKVIRDAIVSADNWLQNNHDPKLG